MSMKVMSANDMAWLPGCGHGSTARTLATSSLTRQSVEPGQFCSLPISSWNFSSLDERGHSQLTFGAEELLQYDSDQSWPKADQAVTLPPFRYSKRGRSPSLDEINPHKRRQHYDWPGMLQPPRTQALQTFLERCHQEINSRAVHSTHEPIISPGSHITGKENPKDPQRRGTNVLVSSATSSRAQRSSYIDGLVGHRSSARPSPRPSPHVYGSPTRVDQLYSQYESLHSTPKKGLIRNPQTSSCNIDPNRLATPRADQTLPYDQQSQQQSMRSPQEIQYPEHHHGPREEISDTPRFRHQNTPMLASPLWLDESPVFRQHIPSSRDMDRTRPTPAPSSIRERGFSTILRTPVNRVATAAHISPEVKFETFNSPEPDKQMVPHVQGKYVASTSGSVPLYQKNWEPRVMPCSSPYAAPKRRIEFIDLSTPVAPQSRKHQTRTQSHTPKGYRLEGIELPRLDDDGTPLESLIRNHTRRFGNVDKGPYNPAKVLPSHSMYDNDRETRPPKLRQHSSRQPTTLQPIPHNQQPTPHQSFHSQPATCHQFTPRTDLASSRRGGANSAISLLTPEYATRHFHRSPLQRSIPMQDRLPPPVMRRMTLKHRKADNPVKKRPPLRREMRPAIDTELTRQKMAADRVIQSEIQVDNEQLERAIFGEIVGENSQEQQQKINFRRSEGEKRRQDKEKLLAAQAEALRVAEEEKRLLEEKIAEQDHSLRKQEEKRKQAKREVERKKQALIDERVMEEKRKRAQEKILIDRQKEKAEQDARALERQKAATIQAEEYKLAELKLKQEAAKLQASSLRSASIFPPGDSKRQATSTTVDNDETLFIMGIDDKEQIYDVDERARAKLSGPSNALEFVANNPGSWIGRPTFQQLREEHERTRREEEQRRRNENCARRMEARKLAKAEAAGVLVSPKKRGKKANTDETLPKPRPLTQSKGRPGTTEYHGENDTLSGLIGHSSSQTPSGLDPIAANAPRKTTKQPKYKSKLGCLTHLPPQKTYYSYLKTPDDIAREQVENGKKPKKARAERSDKEQEERRKKEAEKSREKSRAKIEAAFREKTQKAGYTVSEDEVKKWTEVQMLDRDDMLRKRAENKAIREGRSLSQASIQPDASHHSMPIAVPSQLEEFGDRLHLPQVSGTDRLNSSIARNESLLATSSSKSIRGSVSSSDDDDTIYPLSEQPVSKSPIMAVELTAPSKCLMEVDRTDVSASKSKMIAMVSKNRNIRHSGGRFANLPQKVKVSSFKEDGSESETTDSEANESEEDGDDEETTEVYREALRSANKYTSIRTNVGHNLTEAPTSTCQEVESSSALDQDYISTQIEEPLADMTESFHGHSINSNNDAESLASAASSERFSQILTSERKSNGLLRVYIVGRGDAIDDVVSIETSSELGKFQDRSQANDFAKDQVQEYQSKHGEHRSVEEFFEDNLYRCKLVHDDHNATMFYVVSEFLPPSQFPEFDKMNVKPIIQESAWMIYVKLVTEGHNEAGVKTINCTDKPLEGYYSDLGYANRKAYKYLHDYVKPWKDDLAHSYQHENELREALTNALDKYDQDGECFFAELERSKESIPWMAGKNLISILVYVKEQTVKGPIN